MVYVICGSKEDFLDYVQETGAGPNKAVHLTKPEDLHRVRGKVVLADGYRYSPAYDKDVIDKLEEEGHVSLSRFALRLV